jgi:arginase family enzyme/ribosomal protein S18 acetylase RimI-like enzyme
MSDLTVIEVPQWQGSSRPTARLLRRGAAELAGMVPAVQHLKVDVAAGAGATRDGVGGLDALVRNLQAARVAVAKAQGRTTVTVGGDCAADLAPVEAALAAHGEQLAVVWLDAHGDLNTPASSPSGAFHGMVLRTLLGDGPDDLRPRHALAPRQVVLAGARALDPEERSFIDSAGIRHLGVAELADPAALAEAVAATGASAAYVHIDLDVLDPRAFDAVGTPEPHGLSPDQLTAAVRALAARVPLAGLAITEYEPAHEGAQPVLKQLVDDLLPALEGARPDRAWQIEQCATRAWPPSVVEEHEGWLLRATPGVKRRRSNSAALPPQQPGRDPEAALDAVEAFYAERGLPVTVQVTPAERHAALDALLDARGYRYETPTQMLTAPAFQVIAMTAAHPEAAVDIAEEPTAAWLDAFDRLDGHGDAAAVGELVISRIADPAAHASVTIGGRVAGLGLFVAAPGYAGVFCMATHPEHRRQGIATAILHAGARWAVDRGADQLYLQVVESNDSARRLYARAGFTRSHSYHYRVADLGHCHP